ncbi:antibiotic biosynthesis monooxygenase, partial [Kineococcus vitellinus]|uniref:antibiotic biosynthesis monooxygenase n=1 Tax=Kineococcus vitellinus TaxID=2696565 RepID=UPI001F0F1343
MLVLLVRFHLRDAAAAGRFDELLAAALPAVRGEAGTLLYVPSTVPAEPLVRVVHAAYADEAAHAVHDRAPGMSAFTAELPALTTSVRVEELRPTALIAAPALLD